MRPSLNIAFLAAHVSLASLCFSQAANRQFTCASCHVEAKLQPETDMGHAMENPANDPVLQKHAILTYGRGRFRYTIQTRANQASYSVTDGKDTISLPIHWAFGHGMQTYVLEYKGQFYEGLVSYFPTLNGLDLTMGDESIQPANLEQAIGRQLASREVTACFGCHSTNSVVNRELQLDKIRFGLTCEHCHTNTADHLEAVSHGRLTAVPAKLGRMSAEDVSSFCGQCHRTWETVVRNRLLGQMNVRFQPYRLATSKCFDGSDTRLSCVACHDPHREVVRDAKSYDAKCLACHSAGASLSLGMSAQHPGAAAMKTCPISRTDCASCHMPKVQLPGSHQMFTDHDIRIVRAGEQYPN